MRSIANIKLRYNSITAIIYIIGIVLLLQLFNLQIIHGTDYREQSNTRLARESSVEAARGNIYDSTGNKLAGDSLGYGLELYKTKIDNNTLNNTILKIINVLETNGDSYKDSFFIKIEPFEFNTSDEEKIANLKKSNKINANATAEECFYFFKEKYEIETDSISDARKIISIRYEISKNGYSSTKAISISDKVSANSVYIFREQNSEFPGLNVVSKPIREYKLGNLASHIIGYTGKIDTETYKNNKDTYAQDDYIGKTGIEYAFEKYLKGEDGTKQIDMTVEGTSTDEYVTKEAIKGSDVILTIDANLQKITEEALKNNITKIRDGGFSHKYDANAGAAVVMNVNTGEILAMASYPDYNLQDFQGGISTDKWNEYVNNSYKPLTNKAVQDNYSPGSIYKMVSAIAGLESGSITRTEKINDTGIYTKYKEWPKKCWIYTEQHHGHGYLNVSQAIEKSCNYFFYETGDRMGIDTLNKYAKYFGFGEKTGVELPNETSGTLASKEVKQKYEGRGWYPGDTMSAVIGQGYNSFSPLQMAKYTSMIANSGKKIQPTIIKSIVRADGTEVSKEEIQTYINERLGINSQGYEELNIDPENMKVVREGMRDVTTDGTASNIFRGFTIPVGGKTGSAEAGSKVNAWFVGFAPFDNPEIAVVVFVENGGHGNYTAEAVKEIIAQYFGMNAGNITENMTAIPYTETFR